jgi:hypothetical protein
MPAVTELPRLGRSWREKRSARVSDSPFNAGFGRPTPPQAGPPVQYPPPQYSSTHREGGTSKPFLVTLLFIACVVLGALLNWGLKQRSERARLFERNIEVEQSYVTVLAKRNDLASFLTDPRTRLYRLGGGAQAGGKSVTVAWQQATGTGVLIGDDVPLPSDRHVYALWQLDGGARATLCGTFRPEPGVTFYDFHSPAEAGAGSEPGGFRVTDETDGRPQAPRPGGGGAVYETR